MSYINLNKIKYSSAKQAYYFIYQILLKKKSFFFSIKIFKSILQAYEKHENY